MTPNPPNHLNFCCLQIFVMGEHRDFKFGVRVDHNKSQPMDDKLSLKGLVTSHDQVYILVPLKYLCNSLS